MQNEFFPIVSSIKNHVHEDFPIESYEYSRGNYYCLGLVITNASGEDAGFDVTVKFYDKSGAIVGISNDSNYIVADGAQAFFEMYNDIEFSTFDCEVSPMKNTLAQVYHCSNKYRRYTCRFCEIQFALYEKRRCR